MSSIRNGKLREMYKRNRKQRTSGEKLKKAQKTLEKLEARVKKEGETAWIKDALKKAQTKLKKYGILKA